MLADEWQHQPRHLAPSLERHELLSDPVNVVLPEHHPALKRHTGAVPLAELADEPWASGHPAMGWEEMTQRICRELGGFEPDIRFRANDANVSLALVARGLALALIPDLPLTGGRPGVAIRPIAESEVTRAIFAVTRAADAARPSTQALLAAIRTAVRQL